MSQNEKIKELIAKNKEGQKQVKDCHSWHVFGVIITDLESLLETECEHKNHHPHFYNQVPQIHKNYIRLYDSICDDCGALISTEYA